MSKKNPFNIPNLQTMVDAVTAFVGKNQGKKGFILTDDIRNDAIYDIEFSPEENRADEFHVKAVRVTPRGELQILTDLYNVRFDDQAVKEARETDWDSVQYSDIIYFVPTIFNIAENIEEYVSE